MCVCVCVCVHAHSYMFTRLHAPVYASMGIFLMCTRVSMWVCVRLLHAGTYVSVVVVWLYVCVYVYRMLTGTGICVCKWTCVSMCTYTNILVRLHMLRVCFRWRVREHSCLYSCMRVSGCVCVCTLQLKLFRCIKPFDVNLESMLTQKT